MQHDAYSVSTQKWAFWGTGWQNQCKTTVPAVFGGFFLGGVDASHWEGQRLSLSTSVGG